MCENSVERCSWKHEVRDLKVYILTLIMMMSILIGMCEIAGLHFGDSEAYSVLECDVEYFGREVPNFQRKLLRGSRWYMY
jgi:hypothetical protein